MHLKSKCQKRFSIDFFKSFFHFLWFFLIYSLKLFYFILQSISLYVFVSTLDWFSFNDMYIQNSKMLAICHQCTNKFNHDPI